MYEFKDIIGYEGLYKVSSIGEVFSVRANRLIAQVKLKDTNTNYMQVRLTKQGKTTSKRVHRLVAEAFIPNPENKPCVNHIDNNGENNNVENLEWCTNSENLKHAQRQGRLFRAQSLGGINNALYKRQAMEEKINTLINTKVNNFTILGFEGYLPVGSKGQESAKVRCQCTCGKILILEASRLFNNQMKQCVKCAGKERSIKACNEILEKFKNKIYKHWVLTNNSNYESGMSSLHIKFEAKCLNCGYLMYIPYKSLHNNIIRKCPKCNKQ